MTDEAPRGEQKCNACDISDTDPMFHVAFGSWKKDAQTVILEPSFHHDCVPQEFRNELVGPDHALVREIIAAADAGTRGDALVTFIEGLDHSVQQPSQSETPEA